MGLRTFSPVFDLTALFFILRFALDSLLRLSKRHSCSFFLSLFNMPCECKNTKKTCKNPKCTCDICQDCGKCTHPDCPCEECKKLAEEKK